MITDGCDDNGHGDDPHDDGDGDGDGDDGDGDDDGSDGDKLTTTTAMPVHRNHSSLFFRKITESKPTKIMIEPEEEKDVAFIHGGRTFVNLWVFGLFFFFIKATS